MTKLNTVCLVTKIMEIINMFEAWSQMPPSKKKTSQYYAVVDTSAIKPSEQEKMYASMSASHGLFGRVIQTFGNKAEAEKAKGAKTRVIQVTRDLKPGSWVSSADIVTEIYRGLPNRG
jgi:hypothetical protein